MLTVAFAGRDSLQVAPLQAHLLLALAVAWARLHQAWVQACEVADCSGRGDDEETIFDQVVRYYIR